jgi:hypothetical protein
MGFLYKSFRSDAFISHVNQMQEKVSVQGLSMILKRVIRDLPDHVLSLKLARLAVSKIYQQKGYGNYLIGSDVEKVILID